MRFEHRNSYSPDWLPDLYADDERLPDMTKDRYCLDYYEQVGLPIYSYTTDDEVDKRIEILRARRNTAMRERGTERCAQQMENDRLKKEYEKKVELERNNEKVANIDPIFLEIQEALKKEYERRKLLPKVDRIVCFPSAVHQYQILGGNFPF